MKRTILRTSLWGVLTLSLFSSCRTDSATTEQTIAYKEKIVAFERFEKENNIIKPIASNNQSVSPAKYVSYSYPFAQIIYNFLQAHPEYAKKVENEAGTIRLDAVSQTFGDAKKAVIFPVTNKEGKVIAAWAGVVNENRDYVDFYYLNGNSDNVTIIKTAFQNYYDQKKKKQLASLATASIKGINPIALAPTPPPVVPVVDINEVHITVPPPDLTISSSAAFGAGSVNYGNTLGGGMSGGSTTHGGGSGTGGSAVNKIDAEQLKDYPCAYALAQQLPNLNNDIAKLLMDTFGKDNGINVTFKPADLENADGGTNMIGDKNKFEATIRLDKGMLTQATQEYILATMYHEVVHAYLLFEQTRLGVSGFNESYPGVRSYDVTMKDGTTSRKFEFIQKQDHNRMGPFINGLKDSILKFSPNYPPERAEALAMWGIITEESIPKGYASINAHERESSTAALGKKCNK
ncbi:hypothetical protein BAX94_11345 [Elizabethkingia meningoseptica]|uniref:hypothetical protein n=1 Tax=Elizabethkingia meningoseptica TaxID=238 RepID=UPI0008A8C17F|nr:hypothetical protein [Elizabethkingia meningoseptica]MDE5448558.1 hypothetical protein [Elizabethkingia meningoseptica]MDE5472530.1 hypothetical protein [Elizabethkingia meningoseptica]MDE5520448.1 hypothetical protein [Elizabethkingia meningoseptica]MDE5523836.1 hypothetical protein [Elizabethkingia meningoseptica]OHT28543.1 hypothetical protein BGC12_12810 [Elizabethkingia meningoseptica]